MGKFTAIQTYDRFTKLKNANKINEHSLNFILDTGQLYTHGIFLNNVAWGTETTGAVELTIAGVKKTLSLSNHTHSNYLEKNANIDLGAYKIVSGTKDLLYYSSGNTYLGNTSSPLILQGSSGSIKKGDTTYTILDTLNFTVLAVSSAGHSLQNAAKITYGSSNFLIDYIKRLNTTLAFNDLNAYSNAGVTLTDSKYYAFITLRNDGSDTANWAQVRFDIASKTMQYRTSAASTTWYNVITSIPYNALNVAGIVAAPTSSDANKVWKTDASGNPGWKDDTNTLYYLTLNGTVYGSANTTNLGTFYAIPTSNASEANQVWMRNADNNGYAWRTLGNRAFDSTSYLPLSGGTLTNNSSIEILTLSNTQRINKLVFNSTYDSTTYKTWVGLEQNWFGTGYGAWLAFERTVDSNRRVYALIVRDNGLTYLNLDLSTDGRHEVLTSYNSSVSKSGETLSVKINGTTLSLTNTWRGIQNNLTSDSTTDSLSAALGKALNAKFGDYLPLIGGTMTGNITFSGNNNITWSRNTDYARISFKNDSDGDADSYMSFTTGDNGDEYFRFDHAGTEWATIKSDGIRVKGTLVSLNGHTHDYLSLSGGTINGAFKVRKDLGGNLADWVQKQHDGPFEAGRSTNSMCVAIGVTDDNYGYIQVKGMNISTPGDLVLLPGAGTLYKGSTSTIILDSGNFNTWAAAKSHTHDYLPLSGGNVANYIGISTTTAASLSDSTYMAMTYGRIQSWGNIVIAGDTDGSGSEYVIITSGYGVSNATTSNGLAIGLNSLTWKGNNIIHSGNISSLSVNYATSAGTANDPYKLPIAQVSVEQTDSWIKTYAESNRQSLVYNTSGREWAYWIGMRSSDTSYGTILRLSHDGLVQYAYKAGGAAGENWHMWSDIITSNNIGSQSVSNADTVDGLHIHSGRNNEANKLVRTDGSGYIQAGYINSSDGDENNNSSPARVWGTNGSDSYLRTYRTSALSVNYANSAEYATSAGSATNATSYLSCRASIGTGNDSHASALLSYFNNNYSTIPRNCLTAYYSSSYGNGSLYMGYFLSGYDSNPYGGFYVCHYGTPYYVGIGGGSYSEQLIITSSSIGSQSVNYATSAGNAGSAGNADTLDGVHNGRVTASKWWTTSHIDDWYERSDWDGSYFWLTAMNGSGSTLPSAVAYSTSSRRVSIDNSIVYGSNGLQFMLSSGYVGTSPSTFQNPTDDWYSHLILNHENSSGYYVDLAFCFHSDDFRFRRIVNGSSTGWGSFITSSNISSLTVSNSDMVDNYHASDLVKFYLSPMEGGAPASSAKSWFTETMPSASGAIVYNVPGSEKTIIAGKSSGSFGHMLQLNYDDTYLRILRYVGGNWLSTDWEKISAGYADSAGNADTVDGQHFSWSNSDNNPTWIWGANSNGTAFLASRANMSVNYANSAGSATIANSPYGFSFSDRSSSDWTGVTGTFITDWSHSGGSGADIMFKYNGGALNVITDGYFYQGVDYRGASYRVLDEYDISHTKWGDADTLDGYHASSFSLTSHDHDGRYLRYYRYTSNQDANSMADGWHDIQAYVSNCGTTTNHGTLIQNSYNGTPFQIWIPDVGYYIYKRYNSGSIGGTWSKIYAGYADSAGSVAWGNISGKPFNWSGQSGQPSWLWGSNDGSNYYVWDPSNFNVNYANSSNTANYLPTKYDGGDQPSPQTYFSSTIGLRAAMTRYADIGMGTAWHDTLWINGYSGGDVPYMCALHFKRSDEPRFAISSQQCSSTTYGTAYEVITSYNISNQSVNYATSAGTANGLWFTDDGTLKLYSTSGGSCPSCGSETVCLQTSIDGTDGLTHSHPTNYLDRCVLALLPRGGYVGINTVSPSYSLHVNGSANATTLYENGSRVITTANIGSQSVNYATSAGSVAWDNISSKLFTGVTFNSGDSSNHTHDCNEAWQNGVYYYYSNGPSGLGESTDDGALYVLSYGSSWVAQIAQDYRNGHLFVRGKNRGSWQSWIRIIDSDNIGWQAVNYASSAGSAGNADTVDGYHEYSFLRYRGRTATNGEGTLWSQIGIKLYTNALPDGLTSSDSHNYGSVVTFAGDHHRLELWSNHLSSGGNYGIAYRTGWDNDKQQWARLIDSNNIGSQSVNYANSAGYATSAGSATDSSKLPLAGGTMTGNISWDADSHGVYFYGGVGIEKWSGYGPSLVGERSANFEISSSTDRSVRYTILHTGNYTSYCAAAGHTHNYLPLSGGTLTGTLNVDNSEIWINGSSPRIVLHYPSNNWANISMSDGAIYFNTANNSNSRCDIYAGNIYSNGTVYTANVAPLADVSYSLGYSDKAFNNVHVAHIYGQKGGSLSFGTITSNGTWRSDRLMIDNDGNVGISTASPSCKLDVRGDMSVANDYPYLTISHTGIAVSVDIFLDDSGNLGFEGASDKYYFDNQVSASGFLDVSDIRKKNTLGDIVLNIYSIANAPTFKYTWNDEKKFTGVHVGTSAQYWQTVLPQVVHAAKDTIGSLSMQYDVAALICAVSVAKKVVDHELRITILEQENEALREEIAKLKAVTVLDTDFVSQDV